MRQRLGALLFGGMVGASLALASAAMLLIPTSAVVLDAQNQGSVSLHGGVIEITYHVVRPRSCITAVQWWIWRWDGASEQVGGRAHYVIPIGATDMAFSTQSALVQTIEMAMPAPHGITPGEWFVRTKYMDSCRLLSPLIGPQVHQLPDMPLLVGADAATSRN